MPHLMAKNKQDPGAARVVDQLLRKDDPLRRSDRGGGREFRLIAGPSQAGRDGELHQTLRRNDCTGVARDALHVGDHFRVAPADRLQSLRGDLEGLDPQVSGERRASQEPDPNGKPPPSRASTNDRVQQEHKNRRGGQIDRARSRPTRHPDEPVHVRVAEIDGQRMVLCVDRQTDDADGAEHRGHIDRGTGPASANDACEPVAVSRTKPHHEHEPQQQQLVERREEVVVAARLQVAARRRICCGARSGDQANCQWRHGRMKASLLRAHSVGVDGVRKHRIGRCYRRENCSPAADLTRASDQAPPMVV